jgi:rubredoxin
MADKFQCVSCSEVYPDHAAAGECSYKCSRRRDKIKRIRVCPKCQTDNKATKKACTSCGHLLRR